MKQFCTLFSTLFLHALLAICISLLTASETLNKSLLFNRKSQHNLFLKKFDAKSCCSLEFGSRKF